MSLSAIMIYSLNVSKALKDNTKAFKDNTFTRDNSGGGGGKIDDRRATLPLRFHGGGRMM